MEQQLEKRFSFSIRLISLALLVSSITQCSNSNKIEELEKKIQQYEARTIR